MFSTFSLYIQSYEELQIRVEEFQNNNDTSNTMSKGVVIKLGIVGKFTNDNLNLVSKFKGKEFNVSKMLIKTHLTL